MMRIWMVMAVVGCCLCMASGAWARHKYQFAYKDPVGATRNYQATVSLHINMMGKGKKDKSISDIDVMQKAVEKVLAGEPGDATISFAVTDSSITSSTTPNNPPSPLPVDTEKKDSKIDKYSLQFRRTPIGAVSELKCLSGKPPTQEVMPPLAMLQQSPFNNSSTSALILPAKPVAFGNHWQEKCTHEIATLGEQRITATVTKRYTLTGTETINGKKYFTITCEMKTGTKNMKAQVTDTDGKPVTITMKGNSTEKSTFLFDIEAGEIFRLTTNGRSNCEMTLQTDTKKYIAIVASSFVGHLDKVSEE